MRRSGLSVLVGLLVLAWSGGCAVNQATPPAPRPFGEIAREERGRILTVRDTQIDLRTGMGRAIGASTPAIPVGPVGIRVPITIGGEKRRDVPAEEISVELASGRIISVVQERGSFPLASGERVRVQYEAKDDISGGGRVRVVREE